MTLDRYVATTFLRAFAGALLGMVGLYVVVDGIERLDELMEAGAATALRVYAYQMPMIVAQVIPVVALAAGAFTVLSLQRRNELWAIVSAGVSTYRTLAPVLAIGLVLTLAMLANQEWVIPRVAPKLLYATKKVSGEKEFSYLDVLVRDGAGRLFWVGRYDFSERAMYDVAVLDFYPSGSPRTYYVAETARHQDRQPTGWVLENYTRLSFLRGGEQDASKGRGGVEEGKETLVMSDLDPGGIGAKQLEAGFMGISQAYRILQKRPELGGLRVSMHSKIAFPLSTLVLLLIGVPSSLRWGGRSYLLGAGVGLVVSFFFLACYLASIELGNRGELPAVIAAWLPVSSFGAFGLYLFTGIRT